MFVKYCFKDLKAKLVLFVSNIPQLDISTFRVNLLSTS